ncbi:MAG TPA: permease prefix domain 1-containing protein [Gemmatimonadaceae bacterium]
MLRRLRLMANALLRRSRFERDMADEMRFHMQAYADDLERSGLSRAEAERRARVEFGGVVAAEEECREARGLQRFDQVRQDLRYAARQMVKAPGLTLAAVVSLALGIGANSAMFSVLDAVLYRTLPVREPHELYFFGHRDAQGPILSANYPLFARYRELDAFSGVTAYLTSAFQWPWATAWSW